MLTCLQNAKLRQQSADLRQRYTRAKQAMKQAQQHLDEQSRKKEAMQQQRQKRQDDAIIAESNLISFVSSVCFCQGWVFAMAKTIFAGTVEKNR